MVRLKLESEHMLPAGVPSWQLVLFVWGAVWVCTSKPALWHAGLSRWFYLVMLAVTCSLVVILCSAVFCLGGMWHAPSCDVSHRLPHPTGMPSGLHCWSRVVLSARLAVTSAALL